MFLGRFRKGDIVSLALVTKDAAGVPALPDQCPAAIVYSSSAPVASRFLENVDRYSVTGLFHATIFLGADYSAGYYRIAVCWIIATVAFQATYTFEVLAQGNKDGPVLAIATMDFRAVSYALAHTRLGRVKRLRNPRSL